jgi:hypothetical protein
MKKVAFVIACILLPLLALGCFFKLNHYPGGSAICLFIGYLFTLSVVLPTAIARNRSAENQREKLVAIAGIVSGILFFHGLITTSLQWKGSNNYLIIGVVSALIFLILHFSLIFSPSYNKPKFGRSDTIIVLAAIFLIVSGLASFKKSVDIEAQIAAYREEQKRYDQQTTTYMQLALEKMSAITDSTTYVELNSFHTKSLELIKYIYSIKKDLLLINTGASGININDPTAITELEQQVRWSDFDTPTHYLIGEDPANITGKSKEIRTKLQQFSDYCKLNQVGFNIDLSDQHKDGKTVSWEWASFYHATMAQTEERLTHIQYEIFKSAEARLNQSK